MPWLRLMALVVILLLNAAGILAAGPAQKGTRSQGDVLYFIPHTHWEGAVFKTREEYLEIGLPNILQALRLLKKYPEYRFVLDQVAYVRPFLERYPEERAAFKRFVQEGRLQIVGAVNTMLDVNIPSGESFIRHVLYGKRYYREALGTDVTVGWQLDTFGHHAQMPQLLKLAGFRSYWFFRGVPGLDTPSEFLWEGIDGSRIPAFWLPYGYGLFYGSPANLPEFSRFFEGRFNQLKSFATGGENGFHIAGLAGADVSTPEEHVLILAERFNRQADRPFSIRFAVPTDFEQLVDKGAQRRIIRGELNPVFQGVYSSRIEVKQWMRELERLLTTAEKLAALSRWLGVPFDQEMIWRAWEPVLFNQAHDLSSGVMVDKVYVDTVDGYKFSQRLGREMVQRGLEGISSRIDTRGEGIPLVVFNTLGWSRTDYVEANLGFSDEGTVDLRVLDPQGQQVPVQSLELEQYRDGTLKRARIGFVARDVPALGYSVYRVIPVTAQANAGVGREGGIREDYYHVGWKDATAQQDSASIENEYYRLTFNLWTGEMTSLWVKSGNWEALAGPANVVAREYDGGDFWELYGTLHGARNIAMRRRHSLPDPDRSELSSAYVGGNGSIRRGAAFSEYRVSHPFGSGTFATRVRVYEGIGRIDITTEILNQEKQVRYRALFPSSIRNGRRADEIPFGTMERATGIEFPAQNWFDYSDGEKGMALLNLGLPGSNVVEDTLVLSLMRSARITAYAYHGGYEPGVSSDSGLEVGQLLKFQYALVPHSGDWSRAHLYRSGLEFNNPLVAWKATPHEGILPARWGFLEVSEPNAVISILKTGPQGSLVLRLYEAAGKQTPDVKVKFQPPVASAFESDLLETANRRLEVRGNTIELDLAPFQIRTIALTVQPLPAGN